MEFHRLSIVSTLWKESILTPRDRHHKDIALSDKTFTSKGHTQKSTNH